MDRDADARGGRQLRGAGICDGLAGDMMARCWWKEDAYMYVSEWWGGGSVGLAGECGARLGGVMQGELGKEWFVLPRGWCGGMGQR